MVPQRALRGWVRRCRGLARAPTSRDGPDDVPCESVVHGLGNGSTFASLTMPSAPDLSSRRGLHRVVVHDLGLRIVRRELGAGATLPTEADLSTERGVSRTVIREAI